MTSLSYQLESNLILAQKGKTFFWAKCCMQRHAADAAARLYRFCRYIDDIADECNNPQQAKQQLQKVREDLTQQQSSDPVIQDAIALFQQYQIQTEIPLHLLEGVLSDLEHLPPRTVEELLRYCYQVAGTVGLMMSRLLQIQDARAAAHAIDLGIAMQLTNICRDVQQDALMGRRYLPDSLIGHVDSERLINPKAALQSQSIACITTLLQLADQYYASAYQGLCFIPLRARFAINIAGKLYQRIGLKLTQGNYRYWEFRAYVGVLEKVRISISSLIYAALNPRFYYYHHPHLPQLHQALGKLPYANTQTL